MKSDPYEKLILTNRDSRTIAGKRRGQREDNRLVSRSFVPTICIFSTRAKKMSFPGCLPRASLSPPFTLLFSTVAINRPRPKLGCTCTCAHDISSQRFLGKSTAILRGRFKGADVFPKRPRPAAILPREKIHSPSLSLSPFLAMLQILSRQILKRTPASRNINRNIRRRANICTLLCCTRQIYRGIIHKYQA